MSETPPSLLDRLQAQPQDSGAWQAFDSLYRPLLLSWLRRYRLQPPDADDVGQEILHTVVRELPHFRYDPAKGRFRGWLRAILVNRLREFWRSRRAQRLEGDGVFFERVLGQMEDAASDLSRLWDREHDHHVAARLLAAIEPEFSSSHWQAFRRILDGESPPT